MLTKKIPRQKIVFLLNNEFFFTWERCGTMPYVKRNIFLFQYLVRNHSLQLIRLSYTRAIDTIKNPLLRLNSDLSLETKSSLENHKPTVIVFWWWYSTHKSRISFGYKLNRSPLPVVSLSSRHREDDEGRTEVGCRCLGRGSHGEGIRCPRRTAAAGGRILRLH